MIINGISSLAMSTLMRTSALSTRARLETAQLELATGRHFDMGLALGGRTSSIVHWRSELAELGFLTDRTRLASAKAQLGQSVMDTIVKMADAFMSSLTGARGAEQGPALARAAATGMMSSVTELLNTTYDGQHIFGGLNAVEAPMSDYAGSAAKGSVDAAFLTAFGFSQSDAQVSQISGQQLQDFISGPFQELFDPDAWLSIWSAATPAGPSTRLGSNLVVNASISAASPAFAKLTMAVTMVMELAQDSAGQSAYENVIDAALSLIAKAKADIGSEQSRSGLAQAEMTRALERFEFRGIGLTRSIAQLESVDPHEVAFQVNALMSQLEMSYTITGRLQQMNLMNYV